MQVTIWSRQKFEEAVEAFSRKFTAFAAYKGLVAEGVATPYAPRFSILDTLLASKSEAKVKELASSDIEDAEQYARAIADHLFPMYEDMYSVIQLYEMIGLKMDADGLRDIFIESEVQEIIANYSSLALKVKKIVAPLVDTLLEPVRLGFSRYKWKVDEFSSAIFSICGVEMEESVRNELMDEWVESLSLFETILMTFAKPKIKELVEQGIANSPDDFLDRLSSFLFDQFESVYLSLVLYEIIGINIDQAGVGQKLAAPEFATPLKELNATVAETRAKLAPRISAYMGN